MRFLFRPPAADAAGLLDLPWHLPLEEWDAGLLQEVPQQAVSRYVVRFTASGDSVYALKELDEPLARHEYAQLGRLEEEGLPAVPAVGVCVDRPDGQPAVLVTRHLEYAMSGRRLLSGPHRDLSADRVVDTLVQLLVRLHLAGVSWGQCSLATTLFRVDAGALGAYLADAGAVERHPTLSPSRRGRDVALAAERLAAELRYLRRDGLLAADVDPVELSAGLPGRYAALWGELTREEVVGHEEPLSRVADRLRRLDDLGFDAGEVELVTTEDGARLRVEPRVSGPGRHRRELFRLTGLEVQENQARRLLDDLRSFRVSLERAGGGPVPEMVAGPRWLAEVYQPVVGAIPAALAGRLPPAEVFHEVLEHRWFLSERAGHDVGTTVAAKSYLATVLPVREVPSAPVVPGPPQGGGPHPPVTTRA